MTREQHKWRKRMTAPGLGGAVLVISFLTASPRLRAQTLPPAPQFISAPLVPLTSSSQPSGAALADVNGDGKLDLIVSENGEIDVYLGNGDGTFQSPSLVTTTSCSARSFAVGDIQGAGSPPGLIVSDQCGNAEVFFGNGDGTFTFNHSYPEPYSGVPNPVYLADMNGDGFQDIVVNVSFMSQLAVLFNNPSTPGTFGTAQTINLSSVVTSPEQFGGQIAIANLVTGGLPDLALGLHAYISPNYVNSILVLLNNLTPSVTSGTSNDITRYFSAQPIITLTNTTTTPNAYYMNGLMAADFGNGEQDLVVSEPEQNSAVGTYYFLAGNGTGSFGTPQTFPNEPMASNNGGMIAADLNGDGLPDIAAVNGNDGISLLTNQGFSGGQISLKSGNSYVAEQYPQMPLAGVLTGNGFVSLVVPTGGGIAVMLGNGNGTLRAAPSFDAGNSPQDMIEMSNLNGQAETDLAMVDQADNLVNYLTVPASGPNGTLGPPSPFSFGMPVVGETPTSIAGGCLKAAALPPTCTSFLAIAALGTTTTPNSGPSDLEFELSTGQSPSVTVVSLPTDTKVQAMAVGDFNGDGNNDVAIALSTGEVEVFTGDGAGNFSSSPVITLTGPLDPIQLTVADFNGDGKPDIAVLDRGSSTSAGAVELLLNNTPTGGALSFQPIAVYPVTSSIAGSTPWVSSMTVGDFNGDGAPDVAVVEYTTQELQVFLNSGGTGILGALASQPVFGLTGAIAAGDFNGDGKTDLAVTNAASLASSCDTGDSANVLTGNGDGTFNVPASCGTGEFTGYLFATGNSPNSLVAGNFNGTDKYDLAVADQGGNSVTLLLQTAPAPSPASFTITPASVPAAWVGITYSETLTAPGATGTVTFSVKGGALPPGITLSNGGVLSGAATQAGSFPFAITATASNGTVEQTYNLTVQDTFSLTPGVIDFGTLTVGATGTAALTLTNEYSSTIGFGWVFPVNSPFSSVSAGSTCTGSLAPGASCVQNLTFTPTAIGPASATLCVLINQPTVANACENVPLMGTGALIAVPNVVGETQSTATAAIAGAGLIVGAVTMENSATVAEGDVISESPVAGTLVTAGSAVSLVVSSGLTINEAITVDDRFEVAPLSLVQPIAVAAPVAYFSEGSPMGFNSQSQSQRVLAISNIGQASMTLDSIAIPSGPFTVSLSDCYNGATATGATAATLPSGGFCTVMVTYTGTAPATDTGMLVFTDNAALSNLTTGGSAPDYTQSFTLTGSGTVTAPGPAPPATITIPTINEAIHVTDSPAAEVMDFSLATSAASVTVQPGSTATYTLQLTPENGFTGTVTLSCSGAPASSTCTITPASATLNGSSSVSVQVSVATTAPSFAIWRGPEVLPPANDWLLVLSGLLTLLIALARISDRRSADREGASALQPIRQRALAYASLAAILLCGAMWTGCGTGGASLPPNPPSGGTPAGTYTITVAANSGNLSHSQALTLIVE